MNREGKLQLTGLIEKQAGQRLIDRRFLFMGRGASNSIDEELLLLAFETLRKAGHDLIRGVDVVDPETDRLLRILAAVYDRLALLRRRGVLINDAVLDAIAATIVYRTN